MNPISDIISDLVTQSSNVLNKVSATNKASGVDGINRASGVGEANGTSGVDGVNRGTASDIGTLRTIPVCEYYVPNKEFEDGAAHKALLDNLQTRLNTLAVELSPKAPPVVCCVRYGNATANNELFVINKGARLTRDDDVALCTLKANINREIQTDYPDGKIDGHFFSIYLCLGANSLENYPHYAKEPKGRGNDDNKPTIAVLPTEPRFSFDKMILPESTREELNTVVNLIRLRTKIYDDWGFSEVDAIPRAIVNFYGKPGTGKTMAAHALAHEFHKRILCLNYADVESKFVGDAPKNLMSAFTIAKEHDAVLFFDEADSFLGKRISNVSQGAEQAINSLRSQMLMLLEEFQGVVIFATNLMENYDTAFNSRILKHIQFELPTPELRRQLIQKMVPDRCPREDGCLSDEHLTHLTELSDGFSGREIKNAVLEGITRSAGAGDVLLFADLEKAFTSAQKTVDAHKSGADTEKGKKSAVDKKALIRKIKLNLRKMKAGKKIC